MTNRRRIAVLTTGRQDWGILRSTCLSLRGRCDLRVLAGGMACDSRYGTISAEIETAGFDIVRAVWPVGGCIEAELSEAMKSLGTSLRTLAPEMIVMVGDRSETAVAALLATMLTIPIVHLHGGEETEGAVDNALRHAITKQASLHFVVHEDYRQRLLQMGEDPRSVHVVDAPGLDNLFRDDLPSREQLSERLGLPLAEPLVIVTVHPTTLSNDDGSEAREVAAALDRVPANYVITLPNSDPGAASVRKTMLQAAAQPGRHASEALGERNYWGLLRIANAMVGNSSSGIIEAPAVGLPVVNVGDRQKGRRRSSNVVDVPPIAREIERALHEALAPERQRARTTGDLQRPCSSGSQIAETLLSWSPPSPPRKRFFDYR